MAIGEPRSENIKKVVEKKSQEASSENPTLGGQEQKKGARSIETGLTGLETGLIGPSGNSGKNSRNNKKKGRPSFKQLLAKYEEKGGYPEAEGAIRSS